MEYGERDIYVQNIFHPAFNEARITRLFLPQNERELLQDNLLKIVEGYAYHDPKLEGKKVQEAVQSILEKNLSDQ